MIKILTTTSWNYAHPAGAERVVANILNNLNKDKFDISLIELGTLKKVTKDYHGLLSSNIHVYKLNTSHTRYIIPNLRSLIHRLKPDIIFANLTHIAAATLIAKLSGFSKAKFIFCIHGQLCKFREKMEATFIGLYADKIIAVSQGLKKDLFQKAWINPEKIQVIYNPVDIRAIEKLAKEKAKKNYLMDKPVILGCGRLTEQKGFSYLIRAMIIVLKEYRNAQLVILGQGEKESELKNLAKSFHIENNIHFLGFVKNPFKYMTRADVFVLSSLWEGFGNVIVEAMTCGKAVVSTDCKSGPREILAPDNDFNYQTKSIEFAKYGILVPPKNPELLAQGILKLLDDADLREKYSQFGRERVKDFSSDKIIKQYKEFFNGIYKNVIPK